MLCFPRLLNEVVATSPTVGCNVEEFVYKNVRFLMWDLSGGDMMRDAWGTYYINTHVRTLCTYLFNSGVGHHSCCG